MKGLLFIDPNTGSNFIIDTPQILPSYSLGTTVIAKVVDENDMVVTIEGDIIGIEIQQDVDMKDYTISTMIGYKVLKENSEEVFYVMEDDIQEYYPETNEFDINYHLRDERD